MIEKPGDQTHIYEVPRKLAQIWFSGLHVNGCMHTTACVHTFGYMHNEYTHRTCNNTTHDVHEEGYMDNHDGMNLTEMVDFLVELTFDGVECGELLRNIKTELYAQLDEWPDTEVEGKTLLKRVIQGAKGWNEMLTAMHKLTGSIIWEDTKHDD